MSAERVSFSNPPVVELVLGVQFSKQLRPQDIYEFYTSYLAKTYPIVEEVPALPSTIEKPDRLNEIKLFPSPFSRKHFSSESRETLVQLQNDRLLINWRKNEKNEYPHFEVVYKKFKEILSALDNKHSLSESFNQYEVTYVDHIHSNEWSHHKFVFENTIPFLAIASVLKSCALNYSVPKEELNGNLTVGLQTGTRNSDQLPILVIETTCRGYNSSTMDIWFQVARDIQLRHLMDISTEKLRLTWNPITQG